MKNSLINFILSIAMYLVCFQLLVFLGVSSWWALLVIPVITFAQLYASNRYDFRESLTLEQIPTTGYENRLAVLQQNQISAYHFGFVKFDDFYLKMTVDSVNFAYVHETEPIYLCNYHLGKMQSCDLITKFENGVTLTTTGSKYAGAVPRSPQYLLQNFLNTPFETLYQEHLKSVEFLQQKGYNPLPTQKIGFREYFLAQLIKFGEQTRSVLWIPKLLYWMTTNHGKRYQKSIREQFLAGTVKLD